MQLKLDLKGIETLNQKIKTLASLDEKALLEGVANPIENSIRDSFENKKDPWGKSWVKKDSPTYHHLDSESHNLQGSLHSKINKTNVTVGFNAVSKDGYNYPAVHQFGSVKSSGRGSNIPARPFMPVDINGNLEPKVEDEIIESVTDLIEFHIYK